MTHEVIEKSICANIMIGVMNNILARVEFACKAFLRTNRNDNIACRSANPVAVGRNDAVGDEFPSKNNL